MDGLGKHLDSQAEAVLEEYFLELRKAWADQEELVVRVSQIEIRMLGITGVLDITGTTINGQAQNLVLGAEQIPVGGMYMEREIDLVGYFPDVMKPIRQFQAIGMVENLEFRQLCARIGRYPEQRIY